MTNRRKKKRGISRQTRKMASSSSFSSGISFLGRP
jgi:hypothetical protein